MTKVRPRASVHPAALRRRRPAPAGLLRTVARSERKEARLAADCARAGRRAQRLLEEVRRWRRQAALERKERRRIQGIARRAISENDAARRKISRQLNERILQTLVGINIHLATLKILPATSRRNLNRSIGRTQRLLEKSAKAIGEYSKRLHPRLLDDAGLIPALEACIRDISSRTGLAVLMPRTSEPRGLSGEKRFALYHIAEAALEAAAKRGRAGKASLRIGAQPEGVILTIVDDAGLRAFGSGGGRLAAARAALEVAGGSLSADSKAGLSAGFPSFPASVEDLRSDSAN